MIRSHGPIYLDFDSALAAICIREIVIRKLTNRVCTRYALLERAQSFNLRVCLNTAPGDVQISGEYLRIFYVRVSEDRHSLHIGSADSDEALGTRIPPLGADCYEAEVFALRSSPR